MSTAASVTEWIALVRAGDEEAARKLVEYFFDRLAKYARKKLRSSHRRVADEEDAVISAMDCFVRRAKQGKFEDLHNRDDLWFLLAKITRDKSNDLVRRSPKERGESALGRGSDPDQKVQGLDAWQDLKCGLPFDPSTMIELTETKTLGKFMDRIDLQSRDLLDRLDDDLRRVALLKLQRFTLKEIAKKLGCVPSTVALKIKRIQKVWSKEITA